MRCYDGCPDSELQALLDDNAECTKQLQAVGATATYFPVEGAWMAFKEYRPVTDVFHHTKRQATDEALAKLKGTSRDICHVGHAETERRRFCMTVDTITST